MSKSNTQIQEELNNEKVIRIFIDVAAGGTGHIQASVDIAKQLREQFAYSGKIEFITKDPFTPIRKKKIDKATLVEAGLTSKELDVNNLGVLGLTPIEGNDKLYYYDSDILFAFRMLLNQKVYYDKKNKVSESEKYNLEILFYSLFNTELTNMNVKRFIRLENKTRTKRYKKLHKAIESTLKDKNWEVVCSVSPTEQAVAFYNDLNLTVEEEKRPGKIDPTKYSKPLVLERVKYGFSGACDYLHAKEIANIIKVNQLISLQPKHWDKGFNEYYAGEDSEKFPEKIIDAPIYKSIAKNPAFNNLQLNKQLINASQVIVVYGQLLPINTISKLCGYLKQFKNPLILHLGDANNLCQSVVKEKVPQHITYLAPGRLPSPQVDQILKVHADLVICEGQGMATKALCFGKPTLHLPKSTSATAYPKLASFEKRMEAWKKDWEEIFDKDFFISKHDRGLFEDYASKRSKEPLRLTQALNFILFNSKHHKVKPKKICHNCESKVSHYTR